MPPADLDALALALARFSVAATLLADAVSEVDINPIVVGPAGAVAVDALVMARPTDVKDLVHQAKAL